MQFSAPMALLLLGALPVFFLIARPETKRGWISMLIRVSIMTLLILALAGLAVARPAESLRVMFLLDRSDSVREAWSGTGLEYIRAALVEMGPEDQAGVIVFGKDALVERLPSPSKDLSRIESIPDPTATDLGAALRLGLAAMPADSARRMVVLTDGNAPVDEAEQAIRIARANDVEVGFVWLQEETLSDVWVSDLQLPDRIQQGETFELQFSITASHPTAAGVQILTSSEVVYANTLQLRRGANAFSVPLHADRSGFVRYRVRVLSESDEIYQNNVLGGFTFIEGAPRVLLVDDLPEPGGESATEAARDEAAALEAALLAGGFTVDRIPPEGLPSVTAELVGYDAIALVNVSAQTLTTARMAALRAYVRDLGGGLIAIGGPQSFGLGGYHQTPLEDVLPVSMRIQDPVRRPTLAMVLIIDRSGSMAETAGGTSKLALASEAAARTVDLLHPEDQLGLIVFDEEATWAIPMTAIQDGGELGARIRGLQAGGGTDILSGVRAMEEILPAVEAQIKHAILLTDGGADPAGIPELVETLNDDHGVTVSVVAVGDEAAPFLPELAAAGEGRYHHTSDAQSIPSIFTQEAAVVSRAYLVEETFVPRFHDPSRAMKGLEALPPLHGYVATSEKDLATTPLVSIHGDPILSLWQYGLGRAAAFTADATGRWARDWIRWEGFPTFWGQVFNDVRRTIGPSTLEVDVDRSLEEARLRTEARDPAGQPVNGLTLNALVTSPGGVSVQVPMRQTAPGRYEGTFQPEAEGAYLIQVREVSGDPTWSALAGWVRSYPQEYRPAQSLQNSRGSLLNAGAVEAPSVPGQVFAHDLPVPISVRPVWPELLLAAILLLPLDIAIRRLTVTRADLRRFRDATRRAGRVEGPQQEDPSPPAPITALRSARRRARQARAGSDSQRRDQPEPGEVHVSAGEPPAHQDTHTGRLSESTAAALLAHKRARREVAEDQNQGDKR